MVKKDLERAGIPYRTNAGIADFHAAGRHTHITELLRTGAKLAEAKELARHGDIRMTMRYSHIASKTRQRLWPLCACLLVRILSGNFASLAVLTCHQLARRSATERRESTTHPVTTKHLVTA
jgi:hypothetical protein